MIIVQQLVLSNFRQYWVDFITETLSSGEFNSIAWKLWRSRDSRSRNNIASDSEAHAACSLYLNCFCVISLFRTQVLTFLRCRGTSYDNTQVPEIPNFRIYHVYRVGKKSKNNSFLLWRYSCCVVQIRNLILYFRIF